MSDPRPEPWLRGPVPGIPPLLQPVAHAFGMVLEEIESAVAGLSEPQLWLTPGGAASPGFHLIHLANSTGRLLTYARGEGLSGPQRAALAAESTPPDPLPTRARLIADLHAAVGEALRQLAITPEARLLDPRPVGRAQLPSTVLGLLFHAAEHAQRHTGQLVTTARIIRGLAAPKS